MSELWTLSDMARALQVNPATALKWSKLEGFPEPAFETVSQMRAWDAEAVRSWRREVVRERRARMAF